MEILKVDDVVKFDGVVNSQSLVIIKIDTKKNMAVCVDKLYYDEKLHKVIRRKQKHLAITRLVKASMTPGTLEYIRSH